VPLTLNCLEHELQMTEAIAVMKYPFSRGCSAMKVTLVMFPQ
jgi:hypothetical protein